MSEPTTRDILCICALVANSCPPTEGHLDQCDAHYRAIEAIEAGAHREGATQAFEEARTVATLFGGTLPWDRSQSRFADEICEGITRAEEIFKKLPANLYDIIEEELERAVGDITRIANIAEDWLMRPPEERPQSCVSVIQGIARDCVNDLRGEEEDND